MNEMNRSGYHTEGSDGEKQKKPYQTSNAFKSVNKYNTYWNGGNNAAFQTEDVERPAYQTEDMARPAYQTADTGKPVYQTEDMGRPAYQTEDLVRPAYQTADTEKTAYQTADTDRPSQNEGNSFPKSADHDWVAESWGLDKYNTPSKTTTPKDPKTTLLYGLVGAASAIFLVIGLLLAVNIWKDKKTNTAAKAEPKSAVAAEAEAVDSSDDAVLVVQESDQLDEDSSVEQEEEAQEEEQGTQETAEEQEEQDEDDGEPQRVVEEPNGDSSQSASTDSQSGSAQGSVTMITPSEPEAGSSSSFNFVSVSPVDPYSDLCDYITDDYLSESDYYRMKAENTEVFPYYVTFNQMLINELLAKYAYDFTDGDTRDYYNQKVWYNNAVSYYGSRLGYSDIRQQRVVNGSIAFYNLSTLLQMEKVMSVYGIYVGDNTSEDSAYNNADRIRDSESALVHAEAVDVSLWENLPGSGYLACIGVYDTEDQARSVLSLISARHPDARVIYTGRYQGSDTVTWYRY